MRRHRHGYGPHGLALPPLATSLPAGNGLAVNRHYRAAGDRNNSRASADGYVRTAPPAYAAHCSKRGIMGMLTVRTGGDAGSASVPPCPDSSSRQAGARRLVARLVQRAECERYRAARSFATS
ncbi:hypothetical protein WS67_06470 [Burkholderia singularis]|uniref:Uncharacterized protein n=1 Tax=Burkholderia singularis TaxID=1503053 RepID=A0A124P9G0_9BURK|nr:hypothetical protein WS67_06470 [Burkholderia singularis]